MTGHWKHLRVLCLKVSLVVQSCSPRNPDPTVNRQPLSVLVVQLLPWAVVVSLQLAVQCLTVEGRAFRRQTDR